MAATRYDGGAAARTIPSVPINAFLNNASIDGLPTDSLGINIVKPDCQQGMQAHSKYSKSSCARREGSRDKHASRRMHEGSHREKKPSRVQGTKRDGLTEAQA